MILDDITPLTVLIGQSGCGKSTVMKVLSICRWVMRPYPHPRSEAYITGLAAVRGSQWGVNYAEAFEVILRAY